MMKNLLCTLALYLQPVKSISEFCKSSALATIIFYSYAKIWCIVVGRWVIQLLLMLQFQQ